jgi:hypothetical protein
MSITSPRGRILLLAAFAAAAGLMVFLAAARGPSPEAATASSHREAPLISLDPTADNTDVYAFVSPDRPDSVTIIANYIPLEEPAGGPNFAMFDDKVLYEIHVDNNGDARPDKTFQFRFETTRETGDTFLYNTGPITALDDPDLNVKQTYTVTLRDGPGKSGVLGSDLPTPPVNVGPRSTPDYESLAAGAVQELTPSGFSGVVRTFAGQRDDPFWVDLGSIFDLAGLRPFNSLHLLTLPTASGVDGVGGYNTHAIALQVPIADLVKIPNTNIGVYASASRQQTTILRATSRDASGPFVQVSRLGNPLINEVIIPLADKDRWNAGQPRSDSRFLEYYDSPELTGLANLLYPVLDDAAETGRSDIVGILLTGVPGLNFTGATKADLLRLNTSIAPTAPVGQGSRLGVLDGDLAGFPNGRRLEDDVTDIELRALVQGYGTFLNSALGLPNRSPNNLVGDGVDANDVPFQASFPYVATPHQGYDHAHHRVGP